MAVRYANYAREKSRFGGYCGAIIMHSTPGVGVNNDPTSAVFKNNLPAGYLKCDGTVKSVRDFYALAQILGVGDDCRFKKDGTQLRNADPTTGDLGQFQLPDLGSKVILPNRSTGGKDGGNLSGNSGSGNVFGETQTNTSSPSTHSHGIIRPTTYNPNPFTYSYSQFNAPLDNVVSYVDIDIQNQDKLDQVVTPFILIEYLIKF